ncbi:4Fe-4S dicluster domain-containing protein [Desulfuribacillus stibiiarsenatis]|uniref:4Fe-4S dicluster domain-containing protein n=1 Tax=Desulfuribacillus stibiiarsenatis TaxID=1390249 RepID=UPI000A9002C3|nr:4Fe-4S dicluster domain-containing protein [Desulfuribacillus stibiiarsenatis]
MESIKPGYKRLEERINRFPLGAPPSDTLYKILGVLFTEKEAELVAQLPIRPFTVKTAADVWKLSEKEAHRILERLASRAILLDLDYNGVQRYVLPPPMAGFFEFSIMRTRGDINQKLLSELYYQYLNVEEDFIKSLFFDSETRLGRVFVQEPVLTNEQAVHILDYERATHMLETATHIGISTCYCRNKMHHVDQGCDAPMDICMTFNNTAQSLIKHQYARKVDLSEGLELLQQAYENNLVQCGENVKRDISFICNCCGCCCEALIAARKFGMLRPVHTTNYIPEIDNSSCAGCNKCVRTCPIGAISIENRIAKIDEGVCLGCAVCVRSCSRGSITLRQREERVITPVDSIHRTVVMAIERGKLQNLIFDNHALKSHRAMAAILSTILKLPPLKQAMASKQMKSVYLEKLIERMSSR